jgi:ATP-binding cassette subfamily B protein
MGSISIFLKETINAKRGLFVSAVGMTVLLKASAFAPPLILGRMIDSLGSRDSLAISSLVWLVSFLCIAILFQSLVNPLQTCQLARLVQSTLKEKSIRWTRGILGKEFEVFSSLRLGRLMKSVERGITAHEKLTSFFIVSGFPLLIECCLTAVIFAWLGGAGVFMALSLVSAIYILLYHRLVNWRRPYLNEVNAQEDAVAAKLYECLHAGKIMKLEQAVVSALIPLYGSYADYAEAATKVASTGAVLGSIRMLYVGLSTAGLLAWGVHDQLTPIPTLTVGDLVAVFSIAGMFLANCANLAEAYRTLDQFLADEKALQEVLAMDDLLDGPQCQASCRLSTLSLSPALQSMAPTLRFHRDQSVAIVGPSGAGKSTLLETLAGTVRAERHRLGLNGVQMQACDVESHFNRVRYCPQGPVFLEGRFAHAVLFGHRITHDLARTIDDFALRELVEHRHISEGAKNISGGEAKRLSLLGLFNRPGDFNLFDEPTESLDQDTRNRVWNALFLHFKRRGVICVTHDLSVLPRFDRVIVMKQGDVVADGPWSELQGRDDVVQVLTQMSDAHCD